jgi:hypothetical protein
MMINKDGNVGIGTTNPDNKLAVWGTNNGLDSSQGNINVYTTDTSAINTGGSIGLGGYYNTSNNFIPFANITGKKENSTNDNAAGYLAFLTRNSATGTGERMRITSGGLVGIGTTTPGYDGAGYGAVRYVTINNASGTGSNLELATGTTANDAYVGALDFINTSNTGASGAGRYGIASIRAFTTNASATNTGGGYLTFQTKADGGSGAERMRLNSSGNLGINTSDPQYKLDIYSSTSPATIGLKSDGTYNSIIRDYTAQTDSTLDITTERTDGGGFNFLLLVSSTLTASGANRNYYTFAVAGRGTSATATQLSNVSAGTSSRTAIAVSFPSNGVIRLTLTGGETCQIKVTAIGHGSL